MNSKEENLNKLINKEPLRDNNLPIELKFEQSKQEELKGEKPKENESKENMLIGDGNKEIHFLSNKRKKEKEAEIFKDENKKSIKKEKIKEIKKKDEPEEESIAEQIIRINEEIEKRIMKRNYNFPEESEEKYFSGTEKIKEYQFEIKRPSLNNMKKRNLKLYNYYNKILK